MNPASELPAAYVTVWRVDVPAHAPHLPVLQALLGDDERQRAARFLRHEDAVRSIVARASLRVLLGRATGIAPQDLCFVYGAKGKPALAPSTPCSPPVHFNLSHSGDVVLIAVSPDCAMLGVDVEQEHTLTDAAGMADYVLTPRERAVYESLDASERRAAFYRAWTCKEALVKATGDGLAIGLDHFEVTLAPREAPRVVAVGADTGAAAAWQLAVLDAGPGYAGALAVRGAAGVRVRDLPPP
jgi:4'-phosphopantetheinyl transferase